MTGDTAVSRWFGTAFGELDPLLQKLHRDGGVLSGSVTVTVGSGISGWFGRRLARRMRIPLKQPACTYRAAISHTAEGMLWQREFGALGGLTSHFKPTDRYPDGVWTEEAPGFRLALRVAIVKGGWRWTLLRAYVMSVPVPRFLMFRMEAEKQIVHGRYRFMVRFLTPRGQLMLGYEGELEMTA